MLPVKLIAFSPTRRDSKFTLTFLPFVNPIPKRRIKGSRVSKSSSEITVENVGSWGML